MAIIDVIKYNGGPDLLAWKYPSDELSTWSQLIVNESQEAILFNGGKAMDVFQSGRYRLETDNIPILSKIINIPFGGHSPFTAEVWYINKTDSLDVKWGTPTPIQIQDTKYQIFCPVRANGVFGIQVEDSKKFLVKLVGTMPGFDKQSLARYFRGLYLTKVKDAISSFVVKKRISILEINAYIDEMSTHMKELVEPYMAEYGIKLINFYINDISVPEDDPAVSKLKDALARKAEMDIIGYNYQQERSYNVLEGVANNTGAGASDYVGAGMGLGMGVGLGGVIGDAFGDIIQNTYPGNTIEKKECPRCHREMKVSQRFCGDCGVDTHMKPSDDTKCPKCGNVCQGEPKFCFECGEKLR